MQTRCTYSFSFWQHDLICKAEIYHFLLFRLKNDRSLHTSPAPHNHFIPSSGRTLCEKKRPCPSCIHPVRLNWGAASSWGLSLSQSGSRASSCVAWAVSCHFLWTQSPLKAGPGDNIVLHFQFIKKNFRVVLVWFSPKGTLHGGVFPTEVFKECLLSSWTSDGSRLTWGPQFNFALSLGQLQLVLAVLGGSNTVGVFGGGHLLPLTLIRISGSAGLWGPLGEVPS